MAHWLSTQSKVAISYTEQAVGDNNQPNPTRDGGGKVGRLYYINTGREKTSRTYNYEHKYVCVYVFIVFAS